MADDLITITEAAELLDAPRVTVYHLIKRGDLTPLRLPPKGRLKGYKIYLQRTEVERIRGTWRRRKRSGEQ